MEKDWCAIATSRSLEVAPDFVDTASTVQKLLADAFFYPDGSIEVSGEESVKLLNGRLHRKFVATTGFRSISSQLPLRYNFHYPLSYQRRCGEQGFGPGVRIFTPEHSSELSTESLLVTLIPPSHQVLCVMDVVDKCVMKWNDSVRECGLNGEGPATYIEQSAESVDGAVKFRIDASESGPTTLNWLTLIAIEYGQLNRTIQTVWFGSHFEGCPGWPS